MTTTRKPRGLSEDQLRRWLTQLRRPDHLAGPDLRALLRAHGRTPPSGSAATLGQAGVQLLTQAIERLRPDPPGGREQQLPYLVLKTCFVEGAKLAQAADRLGMSERQLSRERTRAIGLLKEELESNLGETAAPYLGEPIPTISGFVPRPSLSQAMRVALADERLLHVHGPPGIGKTSIVAELAADTAARTPVLWYRFRHGVSDSLEAVLFELGEYLRGRGAPELAAYMNVSLTAVVPALATRLALRDLGRGPQLIVFDDHHLVSDDPAIPGLIEELAARLPELRLVTISRHMEVGHPGTSFSVPPFSRAESRALLEQLGLDVEAGLAGTIHSWTGGIPHLTKLAAGWLRTATPQEIAQGTRALNDLAEVQAFLLESITELVDPDDRAILDAASVFRNRFTDDALASVSGRTRGEIQDASRRLVRVYLATRSREGDTAFFHVSVHDYVHARLDPERRVELHRRAAEWYAALGESAEAAHHAALAQPEAAKPARRRRAGVRPRREPGSGTSGAPAGSRRRGS